MGRYGYHNHIPILIIKIHPQIQRIYNFWPILILTGLRIYFYTHTHIQWRIFKQYFGSIKILVELLFGPFFRLKILCWSFSIFLFQFGLNFIKINAILSFSLNFLKQNNNFSSKLTLELFMPITPTKQITLIHNFNFDEKFLILFNKFNEKRTKSHHFSKIRLNWD